MGKSKQPYYDSNWELYKKAPDDFFVPHSFDEIMEWKVAGWELPASVCCVIRVASTKNGKVKEFIYRSPAAAKKKIHKLFESQDIEFTVADHESIHHFYPENNETEDIQPPN
jgi:hypothetical protein